MGREGGERAGEEGEAREDGAELLFEVDEGDGGGGLACRLRGWLGVL